MVATALWPRAAAQIVARNRPAAVAARMMASGAPTAAAGTTPTRARPSATEPTMKLSSPRLDGSPAGAAAAGAGSGAGAATVAAASSGVASRAAIGGPFRRRPGTAREPARTYLPRYSTRDEGGSQFESPRHGLARRHHDPVLMDLAVDRGAGHAQRLRRLHLVAVEVEQALHDGVALHRLQRAEQPPAHGPALGREVLGLDDAGAAVLHDTPQYLPQLLGVARPVVAQQQLHRLGGADQAAGRIELAQQERHELMQIVGVMPQRRQLDRAREEP